MQAQALAKRLALHGVDEIYASTSNRAIETAQPTADMLGKEITLLDFCNEGHVAQEFISVSEDGSRRWVFADPEFCKRFAKNGVAYDRFWYKNPLFQEMPFEKGVTRVDRETDKLFQSLGYEHDRENGCYKVIKPNEKRVAFFTHQGFGMAFLSSVLDIPYPAFCTHFDLGLSNMTVIDFSERNGIVIPKLLTHSNDAHLYREGLTTRYNGYIDF